LIKIARAYAKINLYLEVLNRRNDGYHNIFSLMASVEASDLLKLEEFEITEKNSEPEIIINCSGGMNSREFNKIPVKNNLITKAVNNYFNKAGISGKVRFQVEKNLPSGAGLGGGSSDAAAALVLLNDNIKLLNSRELFQVAGETGSDVPFCIEPGIAICEGRGEIIERITGTLDCWILLVNNGIHISTTDAYGYFKRSTNYKVDLENIQKKKADFRKGIISNNINNLKKYLKNDFEEAVILKHPMIETIKDELMGQGADFSQMTGSGSTVFGIFNERNIAEKAEEYFKTKYNMVFLTKLKQGNIS
jgi:4-diphosphocytidyl-2-C-methyl-D-erythritol kinase